MVWLAPGQRGPVVMLKEDNRLWASRIKNKEWERGEFEHKNNIKGYI